MLIASKYEEIWAPEVRDFVYISDKAYTREQILGMEKLMLNTLQFNLTLPTTHNFLARFMQAAGCSHDNHVSGLPLVAGCVCACHVPQCAAAKTQRAVALCAFALALCVLRLSKLGILEAPDPSQHPLRHPLPHPLPPHCLPANLCACLLVPVGAAAGHLPD